MGRYDPCLGSLVHLHQAHSELQVLHPGAGGERVGLRSLDEVPRNRARCLGPGQPTEMIAVPGARSQGRTAASCGYAFTFTFTSSAAVASRLPARLIALTSARLRARAFGPLEMGPRS